MMRGGAGGGGARARRAIEGSCKASFPTFQIREVLFSRNALYDFSIILQRVDVCMNKEARFKHLGASLTAIRQSNP
jgi:hypothetical protein